MPSIAKLAFIYGAMKTPIVIRERSGRNLTDYPIKVELDSSWDGWDMVRPDGLDIHFLDKSGHPLYYWIESFDYMNKKATIWVKVPSIPANGVVEIYMRYGGTNPHSAYHDPARVFLFFDDFDYDTLNSMLAAGWAISQKLPHNNYTVTFENSIMKVRRHYTGTSGTGAVAFYTTQFQVPQTRFAIEARLYHVQIGTRSLVAVGWYWDEANGNGYWFRAESTTGTTDDVGIHKVTGGMWDYIARAGKYNFYNKWFRVFIDVNGSNFYARLNTEDSALTVEVTASDPDYRSGSLLLNFEWTPNDQETWIDWIFVRPYTDPEPSVALGASIYAAKDLDLL